jgi:hypothetical protein
MPTVLVHAVRLRPDGFLLCHGQLHVTGEQARDRFAVFPIPRLIASGVLLCIAILTAWAGSLWGPWLGISIACALAGAEDALVRSPIVREGGIDIGRRFLWSRREFLSWEAILDTRIETMDLGVLEAERMVFQTTRGVRTTPWGLSHAAELQHVVSPRGSR